MHGAGHHKIRGVGVRLFASQRPWVQLQLRGANKWGWGWGEWLIWTTLGSVKTMEYYLILYKTRESFWGVDYGDGDGYVINLKKLCILLGIIDS